ncbi:MAG: 6,7-dimethyl-8-ribityllumazine synthase [Acidobacteria bacterium]|nr:6,7-dimethyl-8-ribityllumazine synthase [Acidobacteriota bacterium]MCB9377976.1 6,7-dimethyl-8-ribityllumazine synthase [Holophagales bacterium]
MSNLRAPESPVPGTGRRFAVVAARFNAEVVDKLVDGALAAFGRHGVAPGDVEVLRVPGAWEIPQALALVARSGEFDAFVALGAVIRGDTPHFDFVAAECSRGVARVAAESRKPVAFGVLTCDTLEQALDRAGGVAGNKGDEAALAALEMADLFARVEGREQPR